MYMSAMREELAIEENYENDANRMEAFTNLEAYRHELYIEKLEFEDALHAGKIMHDKPELPVHGPAELEPPF